MNPEPTFILDVPLGDTGLTVRHAVVAVVVLAMAVSIIVTLWNGRRGRRTCGAPRRRGGRCRRPIRAGGCGIHGSGWVARDVALGIVGALGLSLLFWNFEAALEAVVTTLGDLAA